MPEWQLLLAAMAGGVLRLGPALAWVVVGDCLIQRSGHFNLGLEGMVAVGAMLAVLVAGHTGDPWLGVLAAAGAGALLSVVFCLCVALPGVNQLAMGIAMLVGGVALAQFVGFGLVARPTVPLPAIDWLAGGQVTLLLPAVLVLAPALAWLLRNTRAGLLVGAAGAQGLLAGHRHLWGIRVLVLRVAATMVGGGCAGVGGASLGLAYPGGWSDQLASGVGITAVTLVFLARARPLPALGYALAFAALVAMGPAMQVVWGVGHHHLFKVLPYALVLLMLVRVSGRGPGLAG